MRVLGLILCGALCLVGCGDDDDSSSGGGGASSESCHNLCDAQAAAESAGDCVALTASECKQLCGLVTECKEELDALNECQLTGTFSCGLFSAESDADCDAELTAYNACGNGGGAGNGGGGAACTGADANGRCPQVACACPDGEQMISGQQSTASGCACADETTCLDFCF